MSQIFLNCKVVLCFIQNKLKYRRIVLLAENGVFKIGCTKIPQSNQLLIDACDAMRIKWLRYITKHLENSLQVPRFFSQVSRCM